MLESVVRITYTCPSDGKIRFSVHVIGRHEHYDLVLNIGGTLDLFLMLCQPAGLEYPVVD